VSLAGESVWVGNVRAANYEVTLRWLRAKRARLEEVPIAERAPILKTYLNKRAYSKSPDYEAREFFGVSPGATLEELGQIADRYPAFRIVEAP
jgi:hypothetical protein